MKSPVFPLRDANPTGRFAVVTYALIAVNAAVFGFELSLGAGLDAFIYRWGLVPSAFRWETAVNSMFLHGGVAHVLGNLWHWT